MSGVVEIVRRDVLRLSLAALLFLASFAGARMQGEMGALAALMPPGSTMLCSGAVMPAGPDEGTREAHHALCVLCNLPLAAAPDVPAPQRDLAGPLPQQRPVAVQPPAVAPLPGYSARGPPALV